MQSVLEVKTPKWTSNVLKRNTGTIGPQTTLLQEIKSKTKQTQKTTQSQTGNASHSKVLRTRSSPNQFFNCQEDRSSRRRNKILLQLYSQSKQVNIIECFRSAAPDA